MTIRAACAERPVAHYLLAGARARGPVASRALERSMARVEREASVALVIEAQLLEGGRILRMATRAVGRALTSELPRVRISVTIEALGAARAPHARRLRALYTRWRRMTGAACEPQVRPPQRMTCPEFVLEARKARVQSHRIRGPIHHEVAREMIEGLAVVTAPAATTAVNFAWQANLIEAPRVRIAVAGRALIDRSTENLRGPTEPAAARIRHLVRAVAARAGGPSMSALEPEARVELMIEGARRCEALGRVAARAVGRARCALALRLSRLT